MGHKKGWKNPLKGKRQTRLCACGCGQPVAELYRKDGSFTGYARCAPGHRTPQNQAQQDGLAKAQLLHVKALGSRRLVARRNLLYWEVKIDESRRWTLEHRHIIEQQLGRPLLTSEHVHHLDGNGLNNDPANLVLMSASEHGTMTGKQLGGPQTFLKGKPHKCSICKVLHDWPLD